MKGSKQCGGLINASSMMMMSIAIRFYLYQHLVADSIYFETI
jgi:hypothetical protein